MTHEPDWTPHSPEVLANPNAFYDELRHRCPVAYSEELGWSLFRHQDVIRAVHDTGTFSSVVSSHLAVPSGMDAPQHTAYRSIVESYFSPACMRSFEPVCREIAQELVRQLGRTGAVDFMADFAEPFALGVQCAFAGWPREVQDTVRLWFRTSQEATLAGDRQRIDAVAQEFETIMRDLLETSRALGAQAPDNPTTRLLTERIDGRPLTVEEITAILRNWTAGEMATIAASVGILVAFLARDPSLQEALRRQPGGLPDAIEEILRLEAPLLSNRRKLLKDAEVGGRALLAQDRVTLVWAAANRDEAAFDQPEQFRPDRDQSNNLLWGAGTHVCPGAPLARMELRILMECLLSETRGWSLVEAAPPTRALYPASGWASLPIQVE